MEYYVTYKFNIYCCGWYLHKKCDDEQHGDKMIAKLKKLPIQEQCEMFDIPPYKAAALEYRVLKYEPLSRTPKDEHHYSGPWRE